MTTNSQGALAPTQFNFHENAIRVITDDNGEPWFLANDVCTILGYANPRDAIAKHCRQGGVAKRDTPTESGAQEMTYINEGNLYRLIIKSRKPEAEPFEAWVCDDVLPTIRKTGKYQSFGNSELLGNSEQLPESPTQKALPGGLTLEQQDCIKALVKERAADLPKEKQAKAIIKQWSAIKKKFGCSYKEVPPENFANVVSLLARLPLEGELLDKAPEANRINIHLNNGVKMLSLIFDGKADRLQRYLVDVSDDLVSVRPIELDTHTMTEKKFIQYLTQERGYVVGRKIASI